jgi:putative spermidine/putrescine transport system permease protein
MTAMQRTSGGRRSWTFYALAAFFTLFVLFLYSRCRRSISCRSRDRPAACLPDDRVSLDWFVALFGQRTGDFGGSFTLLALAVIVLGSPSVFSVMAGLAFQALPRRRPRVLPGHRQPDHAGAAGQPRRRLMFQFLGLRTACVQLGARRPLTWTLPFGLLIMFAVFARFDRAYEAARDSRQQQTLRNTSSCRSCCRA